MGTGLGHLRQDLRGRFGVTAKVRTEHQLHSKERARWNMEHTTRVKIMRELFERKRRGTIGYMLGMYAPASMHCPRAANKKKRQRSMGQTCNMRN